jgi:hypothetical protein
MVPNLDGFFMLVALLGFIFIPLGMWKLIEIILWLFANVRIGVAS